MHEQGLQKQKGVGPLVGSQERRALLVTAINRLQTACQPLILFPHSVYIAFRLFVLLGRRSGDMSSMPWGVCGMLVSSANCSVGVPSCPAPPRRPAVRPDPTRPWYVRVLDSTINTTRRICYVAHIVLEFAFTEEDDRPLACGQEQPGDPVPWSVGSFCGL